MEQWASGGFQGETRDEILTLNAAALGQVKVYEQLIELSYEQFHEVLSDEDDEGK
jgi:hypothetical protein